MLRSIIAAILLFFASLFGGHQVQFPATAQSQPAAAVVAAQSADPFGPLASSTNATSIEAASDATSDQTTLSQNVKSAALRPQTSSANSVLSDPAPAFNASNFVTQDELNQQLLQLSNSLTAKFSAPATSSIPEYVAAGGNVANPYAPENAINQLSNVTITNANLTASEIPDLSAKYLSLNGGTLTASLTDTGHVAVGNIAQVDSINGANPGSFSGADPAVLRTQDNVVGPISQYDYLLGIGDFSNYTATDNGGAVTGVQGNPTLTASSTGEISYIAGLSAGPENLGSGSVDDLLGGDIQINNAGSGTVDNGYGVKIDTPTDTGRGGFNNNYGLYIQDQTGIGTTSSFNLYSAGTGVNYFGGNVGIGTTSPQAKLDILTDENTDALHIATLDDNPYALIINNNTFGASISNGFGFWQGNDGTGFISDNGANAIAFGKNGSLSIGTTSSIAKLNIGDTPGSDQLSTWVGPQPTASQLNEAPFQDEAANVFNVIDNPNRSLALLGASEGANGSGSSFGVFGEADSGTSSNVTAYGLTGDATVGTGGTALAVFADVNATSTGATGYGVLIDGANDFTGGSQFQSLYGLYIDDQSFGSSNAYQIYSAGISPFVVQSTGNVGVGTTTPYSRLEVWGPDSAASTTAFLVANNASTTEFTVRDNGNATLAGSLIQNSDQRLKTNVQPLNASSSLSAIDSLNPITFNWIDPNQGPTPQLGFIAQQVLPIFPNLVSTTSATALTPGGTLSLNYIGFIAPIISAIQALDQQLTSLANTVAGFAQSFTTNQLTFTRATGNEIDVQTADASTTNTQTLNASTTNTSNLCVTKSDGTPVCVTGDQLAALLSAAGASQTTESETSSASNSSDSSFQNPTPTSPESATSTDTPPVIEINGANPATIQVGNSYTDLGATITGPVADLNLGIETYLNGTLTSNIVIDTSEPATDTIDYVAADQNGLTSTSTRTVIIEPSAAPSIVPTPDAASTTATSTAVQ